MHPLTKALDLFAGMAHSAKGMNLPMMELAERLQAEGRWDEFASLFSTMAQNSEALLNQMQEMDALLRELREASLPDYMKGGEPIWK